MGRFGFIEGTRRAGRTAPPRTRERERWQDAGAPWHTTHITTEKLLTVFQGSGTLLQARAVHLSTRHQSTLHRHAVRGKVGKTPSRGVNWRYCQRVAAIPWDSYERETLYMGNLTYHKTPSSGLRCKEDLDAWFSALDRIFGGRDNWGCIWVMEFQKRGALHYHFILRTPRVLDVDMYHAVTDAWLRITGELEDVYAVLHGCQLSMVQDIRRTKMYECKYMGKEGRNNAKAYEKVCPQWFDDSGRWWGVVGGALTPVYVTFRVTWREFLTVKRVLRSYVRSITHGKYRARTLAAGNGQTILGHGGDMVAYREIVRWLSAQRESVVLSDGFEHQYG